MRGNILDNLINTAFLSGMGNSVGGGNFFKGCLTGALLYIGAIILAVIIAFFLIYLIAGH